jgi:hypothetical protein
VVVINVIAWVEAINVVVLVIAWEVLINALVLVVRTEWVEIETDVVVAITDQEVIDVVIAWLAINAVVSGTWVAAIEGEEAEMIAPWTTGIMIALVVGHHLISEALQVAMAQVIGEDHVFLRTDEVDHRVMIVEAISSHQVEADRFHWVTIVEEHSFHQVEADHRQHQAIVSMIDEVDNFHQVEADHRVKIVEADEGVVDTKQMLTVYYIWVQLHTPVFSCKYVGSTDDSPSSYQYTQPYY